MARPSPFTAAPRPIPLLSVVFIWSCNRTAPVARAPADPEDSRPSGRPRRLALQALSDERGQFALEREPDRAGRRTHGCDHQAAVGSSPREDVDVKPAVDLAGLDEHAELHPVGELARGELADRERAAGEHGELDARALRELLLHRGLEAAGERVHPCAVPSGDRVALGRPDLAVGILEAVLAAEVRALRLSGEDEMRQVRVLAVGRCAAVALVVELLHAPVAGAEVATLNEDAVRPRLIGGVEVVLRLERVARR